MSDERNPAPGRPLPPDDEEELLLWLLGDVSPEEARRIETKWADRPAEVERARRFLDATTQTGDELRRQALRVPAPEPAPAERSGRAASAAIVGGLSERTSIRRPRGLLLVAACVLAAGLVAWAATTFWPERDQATQTAHEALEATGETDTSAPPARPGETAEAVEAVSTPGDVAAAPEEIETPEKSDAVLASGESGDSAPAGDESASRRMLAGTVMRSDYSPVAGARVTLILRGEGRRWARPEDGLTTVTGPSGRFRFAVESNEQQAMLIPEHAQWVPEERTLQVALGAMDIQVFLYDSSSILGRVVPPEGADEVGRFDIEVLRIGEFGPEDRPAPLFDSDRRGLKITTDGHEFEVRGLRPGAYKLRVLSELGQSGESDDIPLGLEEEHDGVEVRLINGGIIAGRVTDGLTGKGVAGATVGLYRGSGRGWRGGRGGERGGDRGRPQGPRPDQDAAAQQPLKQTETGADGSYSLPGVAPGHYEVRAVAEEYVEGRVPAGVDAGETTRADLALFGGKGAIFGLVVDDLGEGIDGMTVRADNMDGSSYPPVEATTASGGRYEFEVQVGKWRLRAQNPNDRTSAAGDEVQMTKPDRVRCDFVLYPSVHVHGRVTRGGEPVAKEDVTFLGGGGAGWGGRGGQRAPKTNEEGYYEVRLRPGEYIVLVEGQQRATASLIGVTEKTLDINIGDYSVTGTVTDAESGRPVQRARMILEMVKGGSGPVSGGIVGRMLRSRSDRSDKNGVFKFNAVEPGVYRLHATADGYMENVVPDIEVPPAGGGDTATVPVTLSFATTLLEVTVTDGDSGEPLSNVMAIDVYSAEQAGPVVVSAEPRLSDALGVYTITNLKPGTYSLQFARMMRNGDYIPATYKGVVVTAEGPNTLSVALRRGGSARVTARRQPPTPDGVSIPIIGAEVILTSGGGSSLPDGVPVKRKTDSTGAADFRPLPAGPYSFEVRADGCQPGYVGGQVNAGQRAEFDAILAPLATPVP